MLLPFHLFEPLTKANFAPDSYVMKEIFPSGKGSCFGLILFLIVWQWGKGAYCSRIPGGFF